MRTRKILIAAGIVVLAAIAIAVLLSFSLNSVVERAIEERGSRMTGTKVRVGSVRLRLRKGEGTIRGLRIENPPGYPGADALRFDRIQLRFDVSTVASNPIVIEEVRIDAPKIRYEGGRTGDSNLDALRANAEEWDSRRGGYGEERRFVLREITIEGGEFEAIVPGLPGGAIRVPFETIRKRDIGGEKGEPADRVAKEILVEVERAIGRSAAREGYEKQGGDWKKKLEEIFR